MIVNSTTFSDFVANMRVVWLEAFEAVPRAAAQLFKVIPSKEKITDYSNLDMPRFARRKEEGDDAFQVAPTQGYRKTLTKYRVQAEAVITWEMRTYDKYDEMLSAVRGMAEMAANRLEIDQTHRFTFANATSYVDVDGVTVTTTVGDGLAFLSTAHTVTGSSTTFRNRIVNNPALSRAALEAAETLFSTQMINMAGEKVRPRPDTLAIADNPVSENIALEYLNSTASPDGAHEGITNVYKSKYKLVVLFDLATTAAGARDTTKEAYFFLCAARDTSAICEISEEPHMIAPAAPTSTNAEEFDNDNWKFKGSAAYAIEVISPQWTVGSLGDGTP